MAERAFGDCLRCASFESFEMETPKMNAQTIVSKRQQKVEENQDEEFEGAQAAAVEIVFSDAQVKQARDVLKAELAKVQTGARYANTLTTQVQATKSDTAKTGQDKKNR